MLYCGPASRLRKDWTGWESKLHLSDGALGILVALGADSPEISSAVVALLSNQRDLGVGIVLGSNLFNLAALLGLGGVIAGEVIASSAGTILDGAVAMAITLIAGALLGGITSPLTSSILVLLIFVPYVYILAAGSKALARLPLLNSWKQHLTRACHVKSANLAERLACLRGNP